MVTMTLEATGKRVLVNPDRVVCVMELAYDPTWRKSYTRVFMQSAVNSRGEMFLDVKESLDSVERLLELEKKGGMVESEQGGGSREQTV